MQCVNSIRESYFYWVQLLITGYVSNIFIENYLYKKKCSLVFTPQQNKGNKTLWGRPFPFLSSQQDIGRPDQYHRISWVTLDNRKLTLFQYYQVQHEHIARDCKQNLDPLMEARALQDPDLCTTTPQNVPRWVQKQWNNGKHTQNKTFSDSTLEKSYLYLVLEVL